VVVRFTGRVDVQDVNDLAAQIARRSGIDDVTSIAIGYKVKIPLDALLPEYLPRDDARRRAWEREQAQGARSEERRVGREGGAGTGVQTCALPISVVVRFTGRVDVQDVNDLAAQIARRSGIDDVTSIAIGYKVKIPLDALLPEYLPRDDARRRAWEREQAQVE